MNEYDVVVGIGLAGLYFSLKLNSSLKVLLITKDDMEKSNSYLAQGGISVLREPDDFESYLEDTLKASRYENNIDAVKIMINESREIVNELINLGVDFDKKEDGELQYTREGAHRINRILHHEDSTGKEIIEKFIKRLKKEVILK